MTGLPGVKDINHLDKEACVLSSKSTGKLLCSRGRDQQLHLVDYARYAALMKGITLDLVSCAFKFLRNNVVQLILCGRTVM